MRKILNSYYEENEEQDYVKTYLKEIGRIPNLERQEEIKLGEKVQKMMEVIEQGRRSINKSALVDKTKMSCEEIQHILKEGQKAMQRMIEANLKLVVYVAKRYQNLGLEMSDLIQEGNLGLERAVEKFNPKMGYRFSTYAFWWIRQAIIRAIYRKANNIRLPIHTHEKISRIKKVIEDFYRKNGSYPNKATLSSLLNMKPDILERYLKIDYKTKSINEFISEKQEKELQDFIKDNGISPEDYTIENELKEFVESLLQELTPEEQKVIRLKYGLGRKKLSTYEIGKYLDICQKSVRKLEKSALKKLSKYKESISSYL